MMGAVNPTDHPTRIMCNLSVMFPDVDPDTGEHFPGNAVVRAEIRRYYRWLQIDAPRGAAWSQTMDAAVELLCGI